MTGKTPEERLQARVDELVEAWLKTRHPHRWFDLLLGAALGAFVGASLAGLSTYFFTGPA